MNINSFQINDSFDPRQNAASETSHSEKDLFISDHYPWHPNYKPSYFIHFSDYVLSYVNPWVDSFRSCIPSKEQMLIRNLPELKGRKITIREIKQIDREEESILQTEQEKKIDSVRDLHSTTTQAGISGAVLAGTSGILHGTLTYLGGGSFGFKKILLLSSLVGVAFKLMAHQCTNWIETSKYYIVIRIKRLKEKIEKINFILTGYKELQKEKILELQIAKLGLKKIIESCVRIYNNSIKDSDMDRVIKAGLSD